MTAKAALCCALAAGCLLAGTAGAQIKASGATTLRFDRYDMRGDEAALPWRHGGDHLYQEFQLRLQAQPDAARRWELNATGVANDSGYRHREQGMTAEWFNFRYEDGGAAMPYRLELGDQRARFSAMTLDKRLQAARVEVQPFGTPGNGHSLVWLAGREQTDWGARAIGGGRFHGASWLVQNPTFGRYALNVVYHEVAAPIAGTDPARLVTSLAGAGSFALWERQDVSAEAELARLDGRAVRGGPAHDHGLRMHLRAVDRRLPLDYEFRYRRHGEGFAPQGTAVQRDISELGAQAGWRFPFGLGVRGRYDRNLSQASRQQLQSEGYGLTVEAPKSLGWLAWMDHSWDVSRHYRDNAWGTLDSRATEARWSIRAADPIGGTTRLAVSWLGVEDRLVAERGSEEKRLVLTHAQRLDLGWFELAATPGMDYRVREGFRDSSVFNPTLRLDAARGGHQLGMRLDYRGLEVEALEPRDEYGLLLDYRYRRAAHTFGLEYEQLGRDRDNIRVAEGWRAGMFWRYQFDTVAPLIR